MLVGNKCDLVDKRKVSKEEGEELARHYQIPYLETSAKNNICVEDSFTTMARQIKGNLINSGKFGTNSGMGVGKNAGYQKGTRLQQTPHHDDDEAN